MTLYIDMGGWLKRQSATCYNLTTMTSSDGFGWAWVVYSSKTHLTIKSAHKAQTYARPPYHHTIITDKNYRALRQCIGLYLPSEFYAKTFFRKIIKGHLLYSASPKNPPLRTCNNFSKTVGNFSTKFYMPIMRSYLR